MKAYRGVFIKKNGEKREMLFVRLEDLPKSFLEGQISGKGQTRKYAPGMELVWSLTNDDFRVFNHSTQIGDLEELDLEDIF